MDSAIALTTAETDHDIGRNVQLKLDTLKRKRVLLDAQQRRRRTEHGLRTLLLVKKKKKWSGKNVIDHPIGKGAKLWSKCFPQRLVVAVVAAREW